MKLYVVGVCFFLLPILCKAQREVGYEVYVNNASSTQLTICDSAMGVVWDEDSKLTKQYRYGSFSIPANTVNDTYGFWYAILADGAHEASKSDTFGLGLYKICAEDSNGDGPYFYLDCRDGNLGDGGNMDISTRVSSSGNNWEWKRWVECNSSSDTWHSLNDGDTLQIWSIWHGCSEAAWADSIPDTGWFEPYLPEDFSVSLNASDWPVLSWDHHDPADDYWTGYRIDRNIDSSLPPGNFSQITTPSKTSTTYLDEDQNLELADGDDIISYRIRTSNTSANSEWADTISFDMDAPSTPSNFDGTWHNGHPKITWNANSEFDLAYYQVLKSEGSGYSNFATTTNTFFVDTSEDQYSFPNTRKYVWYKVKAVDVVANESAASAYERFAVNQEISKKLPGRYEEELPSEFEVGKNYPNPFNPSTRIEYQLPKASSVMIEIIDSEGRVVKAIQEDNQSAGYYAIVWDATSDNGSQVHSGIYFCRIRTSSGSKTTKMLYLK